MRLRCPDCRQAFKWDTEEAWPKCCPLCGEDINNDEHGEVVMPSIATMRKSVDNVYRSMEAASEVRAHQAAEMVGAPVEEMSGLKITNLQDARHPGDIAAMPVNNAVSQMMQQSPGNTGFVGGNAVEYGSFVGRGPSPNVGAQMRTLLQSGHRDMVAREAIGRDEKGRPVVPNLNVVSDRPANETLQPGYRRRG